MPLRSLIYLAETIKPMVDNSDLYGYRRIRIPTPRFVVFYNGLGKRPEHEIQRLSDAYDHNDERIPLELICEVYNINPGMNVEIVEGSSILREYCEFVEVVRRFIAEGRENPIDEAIEYCIADHILEYFLRERGDEVKKNMTIDMTFEKREKFIRQDGFEQGLEEGIMKGKSDILVSFLRQGLLSIEDAAKGNGLSVEEIQEMFKDNKE